ncbi:DUF551 domain-containing protein [Yersinia intermedia]|uniref:DUF551 domain-containing protein n=1 Tax=Yersinia intermedia TaxID=631 RepID=A0ABX6F5K2_YERIN|nr:DUF551 domain-containing protein [Yersinia intermedia]QGR65285.1 DUF551 domain-containing protein [Yersinia intermedia]QGR70302.1 DUF551 domain-containing protein [Yersinia intermedia]
MKELDSFTVERLEELGAGAMFFTGDEVAALARIALAAKRAEPVSLESAIAKFKEYNIGFPVEKLKADFVISWCLTNLSPQLNSQVPLSSWINCIDQMPEDDTLCLGADEYGVIWTMHFDGEFRADTGWPPDLNVIHWMPLPDAPEKPL